MEKLCSDCLYRDECLLGDRTDCEDYVAEDEEKYLEYLIEKRRKEFYKEWFCYVNEYN